MQTAVFTWCKEGNLEALKAYAPLATVIHQKSPEGWTPLVVACFHEHYEVAEYLISQGADVNATNHKGTTVLMYAKTPVATSRQTALLELLLAKGADINAQDIHGKTALDYVSEKGIEWLRDWMITRGAQYGSSV